MSSSSLGNEVEDLNSSSSSGNNNLYSSSLASSSSSSVEKVGRNDDILMEILLCLPVKSLIRFKLVSKQWLSLISDRYFANNHIRRNNSIPPPVGLFLNRRKSHGFDEVYHFLPFTAGGLDVGRPFKTLNFSDTPPENFPYCLLSVTHSCNGLLCCKHYHTPSHGTSTIYVYNPSINQYKLIPTSPFRGDEGQLGDIVHSISLAFDPLKSPHYQLVCIYVKEKTILANEESPPDPNFHIEIYSSETSSWRLSGKPFQAPWGSFMSHGIFWNGSLHWFHRLFDDYDVHSFCFNVEHEIVKPMPMPIITADDDLWDIQYFGECMGHLHLIVIVGPCPTGFDILEMQNDYACWNFRYRVNLESLLMTYPEITRYWRIDIEHFRYLQVLCVTEEDQSSSLLLVVDGEKVISYDLKNMSFKKTHDLPTWREEGRYRSSSPLLYVHQYIKSLAHCV